MFGALLEVDMFKKCTAPWREGCGTKHMSKSKSSKHTAFDFWDLRCFARHNGVHFSSSQLPKAVRTWCVLCILTSKRASRHNGAHFSTSQLPKVVRRWCALYILTWKRALRHNGVHFFIISVLRDFPTFLRTFIFFLLTFSFSISFFFSSLL